MRIDLPCKLGETFEADTFRGRTEPYRLVGFMRGVTVEDEPVLIVDDLKGNPQSQYYRFESHIGPLVASRFETKHTVEIPDRFFELHDLAEHGGKAGRMLRLFSASLVEDRVLFSFVDPKEMWRNPRYTCPDLEEYISDILPAQAPERREEEQPEPTRCNEPETAPVASQIPADDELEPVAANKLPAGQPLPALYEVQFEGRGEYLYAEEGAAPHFAVACVCAADVIRRHSDGQPGSRFADISPVLLADLFGIKAGKPVFLPVAAPPGESFLFEQPPGCGMHIVLDLDQGLATFRHNPETFAEPPEDYSLTFPYGRKLLGEVIERIQLEGLAVAEALPGRFTEALLGYQVPEYSDGQAPESPGPQMVI